MPIQFNKPYDRQELKKFLENDFLQDDFESAEENISIEFPMQYIQKAVYLGESPSLKLKVFEIYHHSENDPRVGISKELFRIMRQYGYGRALVLLHSSKSSNYRLSLATIEFKLDGLFEPHDDDHYTGKPLYSLEIKDSWFEELFKVFETYNFTIDENTSVDVELSVEPEMLGRIFENLLAEINPETGESARKSTGSFYTPRPIVEYMVDESIKQYLHTHTGVSLERLAGLLSYSDDTHDLNEKEKQSVMQALSKIKILDPACGSGAFPMGCLQKILLILQKLDPEAQQSLNKVLVDTRDATVREMLRRKLQGDKDLWNYTRKLSVIRDSIYGVDIQPIAVEISKLRFFLSLVVDEKINENEDNRGIEPLPNLEFKFVCANTLIGLPPISAQMDAFEESAHVQKLKELRDEYFTSYGDQKKKIEKEIDNLQKKMADDSVKNKEARAAKLALWKPFSDEASSWFDPEWMFGIKNGFDVVIGNPPYVQLQKDSGFLARMLKDHQYETYERTGDVYAIFYELGLRVLNNGGVLTFITSSQWMKANYGKSLRKLFLSKNPLILIALGPGIFESATVDTNILICKNEPYQKILRAISINKFEEIERLNALTFYNIPYVKEEAWVILDPLKLKLTRKIESNSKPLNKWKISINRGILTGYNEAFIIDESKKKELIKADSKSKELIKPVLRGREVKSYSVDWKDEYILFIPWHFPDHNNNRIIGASEASEKKFHKEYPSVYEHLQSHKKALKERNKAETGIRYEWYALQRCAATYLEEFTKEKIIWKRIGSQLRFSYSDAEIYCLDSTCIATGEKIKYLAGLLNSSLCKYQLFETAPRTGMGDLIISVQALEPLLVHYPTDKEEQAIVGLVDKILAAKKKKPQFDTTLLARKIDVMVYKLYELTYDEVKIVDPEFWLSRAEYEKFEIGNG